MSSSEESTERKPRKSVAFSEGTTIVDANGAVTMKDDGHDDKNTALSHSPNDDVKDDDDLANLLKKKKKKSKKPTEEGDAEAATADGGLDLTLKKKKKKKVPKEGAEDDFASRLAALEIEGGENGESAAAAAETAAEPKEFDEAEMETGVGIWAHDDAQPIVYELLLSRFFSLLAQKDPDHASSGTRSYKIPPPQCLREGNKKTIFANISEICKRMKRTDEHVTSYLFAELGTSGSVDGSKRLVIKGRFQQKQIENVLRRYIMEYVTCKTCRSPDTELNKGENRLYFITCNKCQSRRSVTAIKTGFSAQVGKRRRQQG